MHEKERPKASYQLPQGATLVALCRKRGLFRRGDDLGRPLLQAWLPLQKGLTKVSPYEGYVC